MSEASAWAMFSLAMVAMGHIGLALIGAVLWLVTAIVDMP